MRDIETIDSELRLVVTLHRAARERGWTDVIAEGVGKTVSATVEETVAAVGALASAEGVGLRVIADKPHLDKSTVSRRVRVAADGGYLRNLEDKRGKPGRWVIGDPLPDSVDSLPEPAQLATGDGTPDQECCSVAAESGGKNRASPKCDTVSVATTTRPLGGQERKS